MSNNELSSAQKPHTTKSTKSHYTLDFDPISNSKGLVSFVDRSKGNEQVVDLTVDDEEFSYRVLEDVPPIIADIIDLAVAIHASDRLASQDFDQQRRLEVTLPVRHPELLGKSSVQLKLTELLDWTTGSQWYFDFKMRNAPGRSLEQQPTLPLAIAPQDSEVTLWSGGLDSLAGLYTRLQKYPDKSFVLLGSGGNNTVYARQKSVALEVQSIFPSRLNPLRIPIRFDKSAGKEKNKYSRARGVVFMLVGLACAYLMDRRELYLYENGIGAINLPYRASAIGLDHSRSVHPLTLLMVSEFVSELLGDNLRVKNPFLFSTKAEMCQALAKDDKKDLVPLTQSCDSRHRKKSAQQCGYCSSCILRRQALSAAKIEDKTSYVVLNEGPRSKDRSLHFRNMDEQVKTFRRLLNTSDDPTLKWKALTREFLTLDDIVDRGAEAESLLPDKMRNPLLRLYQTYVCEWEAVRESIATGLLNKCGNQQEPDSL